MRVFISIIFLFTSLANVFAYENLDWLRRNQPGTYLALMALDGDMRGDEGWSRERILSELSSEEYSLCPENIMAQFNTTLLAFADQVVKTLLMDLAYNPTYPEQELKRPYEDLLTSRGLPASLLDSISRAHPVYREFEQAFFFYRIGAYQVMLDMGRIEWDFSRVDYLGMTDADWERLLAFLWDSEGRGLTPEQRNMEDVKFIVMFYLEAVAKRTELVSSRGLTDNFGHLNLNLADYVEESATDAYLLLTGSSLHSLSGRTRVPMTDPNLESIEDQDQVVATIRRHLRRDDPHTGYVPFAIQRSLLEQEELELSEMDYWLSRDISEINSLGIGILSLPVLSFSLIKYGAAAVELLLQAGYSSLGAKMVLGFPLIVGTIEGGLQTLLRNFHHPEQRSVQTLINNWLPSILNALPAQALAPALVGGSVSYITATFPRSGPSLIRGTERGLSLLYGYSGISEIERGYRFAEAGQDEVGQIHLLRGATTLISLSTLLGMRPLSRSEGLRYLPDEHGMVNMNFYSGPAILRSSFELRTSYDIPVMGGDRFSLLVDPRGLLQLETPDYLLRDIQAWSSMSQRRWNQEPISSNFLALEVFSADQRFREARRKYLQSERTIEDMNRFFVEWARIGTHNDILDDETDSLSFFINYFKFLLSKAASLNSSTDEAEIKEYTGLIVAAFDRFRELVSDISLADLIEIQRLFFEFLKLESTSQIWHDFLGRFGVGENDRSYLLENLNKIVYEQGGNRLDLIPTLQDLITGWVLSQTINNLWQQNTTGAQTIYTIFTLGLLRPFTEVQSDRPTMDHILQSLPYCGEVGLELFLKIVIDFYIFEIQFTDAHSDRAAFYVDFVRTHLREQRLGHERMLQKLEESLTNIFSRFDEEEFRRAVELITNISAGMDDQDFLQTSLLETQEQFQQILDQIEGEE